MPRYIDADALKNKITELDGGSAIDGTGFDIYTCEVFELIDEIPVADVVEVVHGKWIPRTNLPKQEIFICSVCDGWAYSPWIGNRKNPKPNWCKYKYCPNCGAKMEVIK